MRFGFEVTMYINNK
ncbi:MAG: pyrroloquinoline quinone precursor peptide PqqA [Gammaproteobacteria bacterium]